MERESKKEIETKKSYKKQKDKQEKKEEGQRRPSSCVLKYCIYCSLRRVSVGIRKYPR